MAKKYKFTALPVNSIDKYKAEIKSETTPVNEDDDIELKFNSTFDLSELNLSNLIKSLTKSVKKGTKLFHFTQQRENDRITLKIEHIRLLQTALQETRKLGKEIMEVRADNFLTPETIRNIIEGKRIDLKYELEIKIEAYKSKIHYEKYKREREELDLLNMKADIALKTASADLINAKTKEQIEMAQFMKNAAEEFKSLPTGAKLLMIHDFMNRHKNITDTSNLEDYDFNEFLKETKKQYFDEGLKQEQAKTVSSQAQADFDRYRTDKKTGKI